MLSRLRLALDIILFKGGEDSMVVVYATLIIYGRRTFEKVPKNLQEAVQLELASMGLGTNGKPLPEGE